MYLAQSGSGYLSAFLRQCRIHENIPLGTNKKYPLNKFFPEIPRYRGRAWHYPRELSAFAIIELVFARHLSTVFLKHFKRKSVTAQYSLITKLMYELCMNHIPVRKRFVFMGTRFKSFIR